MTKCIDTNYRPITYIKTLITDKNITIVKPKTIQRLLHPYFVCTSIVAGKHLEVTGNIIMTSVQWSKSQCSPETRVRSGYSGFLPQRKLTGWVR